MPLRKVWHQNTEEKRSGNLQKMLILTHPIVMTAAANQRVTAEKRVRKKRKGTPSKTGSSSKKSKTRKIRSSKADPPASAVKHNGKFYYASSSDDFNDEDLKLFTNDPSADGEIGGESEAPSSGENGQTEKTKSNDVPCQDGPVREGRCTGRRRRRYFI